MKVGILTFHYGRNYGALLQAYGLRKAIEFLGHDAAVIHYIPEHCHRYMPPEESRWLRLGWRTYGPRLAIQKRLRTYGFSRFRQRELHLTKRCQGKGDLIRQVAELGVLVVGSDQVWNLNFVRSTDLCYFIDFPRPKSLRCISYAACSGQKDQPTENLSRVSTLLEGFHAIGVRNEFTREFVNSLTGRESTVVADPTLLVDYPSAGAIHAPRDNYVLAYFLEHKSFDAYAKVLSEVRGKLRLPVWVVADGNAVWQDIPFSGADRDFFGVSPTRFLNLVKHATCLLTDSFHGTILSVRFGVPFLVLNDGGWRNMRMLDLANRYGIAHRIKEIHDTVDTSLLTQGEDLRVIQERFETHKVVSYDFLRKALAANS